MGFRCVAFKLRRRDSLSFLRSFLAAWSDNNTILKEIERMTANPRLLVCPRTPHHSVGDRPSGGSRRLVDLVVLLCSQMPIQRINHFPNNKQLHNKAPR